MAKIIKKNSIKIRKEPVVILPKMGKKEYRAAWRNFEKMLKKAGRLWRTKKSSLEIIREERE